MDTNKSERINNFLCAWGYRPEQLAQYLRDTAPDLAPSAARAQKQANREFWDAVVGRERTQAQPSTPIPRPENTSKECIESDLFLMLGIGENAVTLEDLSAYIEQRELSIKAGNTQAAEEKRMFMSNLLHAMNADEDDQRRKELEASFANSERLRNQKVDMNDLLRNAPGACDSTPRTIIMKSNDKPGSTFNDHLRGLDSDNRI